MAGPLLKKLFFMLDELLFRLGERESFQEKYNDLFEEISIPPKSIILNEGEVIKKIYFVKSGCLRLWFNSNGRDITYQFFLDKQVVSGILDNEKSMFTLESVVPSIVVAIRLSDFKILINEIPGLKDGFIEYILNRLSCYSQLFLSRIRDNPQIRYNELLKENPEILKIVPQKHIASYLGITPVSLSRIRNRKTK